MNNVTKRNIHKKEKKTKTKKNKKYQNNKKKYISKKLLKNSFLYASKRVNGKDLLDYTKQNQIINKKPCVLNNISWFGSYEVAKSYKTHETHLYQWKIKKNTSLFLINETNKKFFQYLFLNTTNKIELSLSIKLTKENIKMLNENSNKIKIHPYINMSINEKAYYEFCFVFGYITIDEQFKFMKFLKYLLEKKIIIMNMRDGNSILKKLFIKMNYYHLTHLFYSKKENNRLSFYDLDKHAVYNICRLVKSNHLPISGIFQANNNSFWFPNLLFYKMNIEETILFQPHETLIYDKMIE